MGAEMELLLSLILVPFTGILVRYRASYYPKAAAPSQARSTSAESSGGTSGNSGSEPLVAKTAPGLLEVAKRVRRVEGWAALYNGFLPTLLFNLFLPILSGGIRQFMFPTPTTSYGSLQSVLFYNLSYIPGSIFVYRAIVTPHKLEYSGTSIRTAMQTLSTDYERKKPWVLWLNPGLLPAFVLNIILRILALRPLRQIIEPDQRKMPLNEIYYLRVGATILLLALFTAILTPLDVIVTRLAIQRNYGGPESDPTSEVLDVEVVDMEKAGAGFQPESESEEFAVPLRQDKDLYQNPYHCATRIVREEGWRVLYRGWWLVCLSTIYCI